MLNDENPARIWFRFDRRRAVALDDVGGGDYRAVVVMGPDDEEGYALLSTSALRANEPFPPVVVPGHEWAGRLPFEYRRCIEAVMSGKPRREGVPCCGRLTLSGNPCRNQVRLPRSPCYLHENLPLPD
jgi:hypothetical protein